MYIENVSISIGNTQWNYRFTKDHDKINTFRAGAESSAAAKSNIVLDVAAEQIDNLAKILNREQGTVFDVDAKGQLEEIHQWEVSRRFFYWGESKTKRVEVNRVIKAAIGTLDASVAALSSLTEPQKSVLKVFLEDHFYDRGNCARLRADIFDRSALADRQGIQSYLAPEFAEGRASIKEMFKESRNLEQMVEKRQLLQKAAYAFCHPHVKVGMRLGIPLERLGGGSGGPRTGSLINGKKVLVIKPGDEGPYGENNPSFVSWFKQFFFSIRRCLAFHSEPRAEVNASIVDDAMELGTVPHTEEKKNTSYQFVRIPSKECSEQLFIKGAKTLGDYLGIAKGWRSLPRSLRCCFADYLAKRAGLPGSDYPHVTSWWKRINRHFFAKILSADKPLPPLPAQLLERAALSKFLDGDIDTHFDNTLVLEIPKEVMENAFLNKLFSGEATDEEIENFVDHELEKGDNYEHLLYRLFESLPIEEGKRIAIINHDGGASTPHMHPHRSGIFSCIDYYLSTRFRWLFEVHPEFEKPFSPETMELVKGKEGRMLRSLVKSALLELVGSIGVDTRVFALFWHGEGVRVLFKKAILEGDSKDLKKLGRLLATLKLQNVSLSPYQFVYYSSKFERDMERIRGIVKVRSDHYRFMLHHIHEKPHVPKRELFHHFDKRDFNDEKIKDSDAVKAFDELVKEATEKPLAPPTALPKDVSYEYLKDHIDDFVRELIG